MIYDFLYPIIENEKEKEFKRQRGIKTSWKSYIPCKEIARACTTFSSVISLYREAKDELHKFDQETQDILHALELTNVSEDEYGNLAKEL